MQWCTALSQLVVTKSLTPQQLIELVRGQHILDYRPNKALCSDDYRNLYHNYHHQATMITIANEGFRIPWKSTVPPQQVVPPNHGSARNHDSTLMRLMQDGQVAQQYVFVTSAVQELWQNLLFFSPLGLVPKGNSPLSEIGRVIQDLSYPLGHSINDFTNKDMLPLIAQRRAFFGRK